MTTGPEGPTLASAAVEIEASFGNFDNDLRDGVTRSVRDASRSIEREMRRSGERAGQEFGAGVTRGADGRLRDMRGRFVAELARTAPRAERSGLRAGRSFGSGFLRGFNIAGISLGPRFLPLLAAGIAPLTAGLVTVTAAAVQFGQVLTAGLVAATAAAVQLSGAVALIPAAIAGVAAFVGTLKVGLNGIDDAFKALAKGDADKLAEAMKKLAPSARAFVREIKALGPAWRALRLDVQQRLFAGLAVTVRRLADGALPTLRAGLAGIAGELSVLAQTGVNAILDPAVLGPAAAVFDNIRRSVGELGAAVGPLVRAFATLAAVGSGAFPRIARAVGDLATRFEAFIEQARASGALQDFINGALSGFASLGRTVLNVVKAIAGIARAGEGAGAGLFSFLENITARFSDFINSTRGQNALRDLLAGAEVTARTLGTALLNVVRIIGGIARAGQEAGAGLFTFLAEATGRIADFVNSAAGQDAIGNLLSGVATAGMALGEALDPILQHLPAITGLLGQLLGAIRPLLGPLGSLIGAFGTVMLPIWSALVTALTPIVGLLPRVLDAFAGLVLAAQPLVPPIQELIAALGTLVKEALQPVIDAIPQLIDIIEPLLPQLIPLIQGWKDLVVAITPVIVTLAQLGAAGGKLLLPILVGLTAVLIQASLGSVKLFQALLGLPNAVINVGISVASFLIAPIVSAGQAIGRVAVAIPGFIVTMAGKVIGTLAGWAGQVVSLVGRAWNGARRTVATITGQIVARVVTFASNVISSIGRGLSGVGAAIARPFSDAVGTVGAALKRVRDTISGWLDRIKGLISQIKNAVTNIPTPNLPGLGGLGRFFSGFAGGGIVERETIIRAGERNRREAILPLKLPSRAVSIIRSDAELSAIAAAATGGTGSGGRTVEVHAPVNVHNYGSNLDADAVAALIEQRLMRAIG